MLVKGYRSVTAQCPTPVVGQRPYASVRTPSRYGNARTPRVGRQVHHFRDRCKEMAADSRCSPPEHQVDRSCSAPAEAHRRRITPDRVLPVSQRGSRVKRHYRRQPTWRPVPDFWARLRWQRDDLSPRARMSTLRSPDSGAPSAAPIRRCGGYLPTERRKNDDRRHHGRSADRHIRRVCGWQVCSASGGLGHAASRR